MEESEGVKFLNKKHIREKKKNNNETKFFIDENEEEDKEKCENFAQVKSDGKWRNKTRTLVVASRGISHQERHLVNDIISLLPHSKKECKIEKGVAQSELSEICYNHSCKQCLYFEHRKHELILWMIKTPDGPCANFQVRNVHTLNEIKLMGNCLKYSRPLLSFDKSFDASPHLQLLKELFIHTFNSPKNHPKTKPFYDHIICFYNVNNQIFFRNYQILNDIKERFSDTDDIDKMNLLEIGPRMSMNLIRVFEGCLGGKTLYENPSYRSPSVLIRRKMDHFKKRKLKDDKEKESLHEKISNVKEEKHDWLNL